MRSYTPLKEGNRGGIIIMNSEMGLVWPQTKECWQPSDAKRGKEWVLP